MKKAFEKAMSNLKIRRKLKVKAILSLILLISHRWDDHCDENRDSWGTTKLNFLQLGGQIWTVYDGSDIPAHPHDQEDTKARSQVFVLLKILSKNLFKPILKFLFHVQREVQQARR
ncbi:hypothetical protein [Pyrococcus kukulkanii]|uniref:hypothetical protein n=1 Tax=Pyrococcus kukulkanii TaxID=1609559 RepID=UPI003563212A